MGEEVVEGKEIGYDFIAVVVCDFIVEPGIWEWEAVLRCHSLFRFEVVRLILRREVYIKIEIGFSCERSMIFIFDSHFMCTNP